MSVRASVSSRAFSEKLFIAGVPSGIKPEMVVEYFCQFGQFSLYKPSENLTVDHSVSLYSKGHCVLTCANRSLADWAINQKYFVFLGRTLTVSLYRIGSQLIVENKRQNKCRVIFKKVSSKISEEDFKKEIECRIGELLAFFQFKSINPLGHKKAGSKFLPKHFTYSAIFKDKQAAANIIEAGGLALNDGTFAEAHKFQKAAQGKSRNQPRLMNKTEKVESKACITVFESKVNSFGFPKQQFAAAPTTKSSFISADGQEFLLAFIKPTSNRYFRLKEEIFQGYRFSLDESNARFNLSTIQGPDLRQVSAAVNCR